MNHEQVRHFEKVVSEVGKTLVKNPRASINDLCRACKDAGLQVSKPLVARARKVIVKAVADRNAGTLKDTVDAEGHPAVLIRTHTPPELMAPPTLSPQEKADKLLREDVRVAERKARELEREAQWAKEREEERKAFEATHTKVVEAMREEPAATEEPLSPAPPAPLSEVAAGVVEATTGRTRSANDRALRRQYLNELLDLDPGADPIVLMGKVKERYGMGLDGEYVYDTCRVARELAGLPQIPYVDNPERAPHERPGLPVFEVAAAVEKARTAQEDFEWLVRQVRDVMRAHNLSEFHLSASEAEAEWTFTEKPRTTNGKMRF